jgi:hypothetical protein
MIVIILVSALTSELAPKYKNAMNKKNLSENMILLQKTNVGIIHNNMKVKIIPFIGITNKDFGLCTAYENG